MPKGAFKHNDDGVLEIQSSGSESDDELPAPIPPPVSVPAPAPRPVASTSQTQVIDLSRSRTPSSAGSPKRQKLHKSAHRSSNNFSANRPRPSASGPGSASASKSPAKGKGRAVAGNGSSQRGISDFFDRSPSKPQEPAHQRRPSTAAGPGSAKLSKDRSGSGSHARPSNGLSAPRIQASKSGSGSAGASKAEVIALLDSSDEDGSQPPPRAPAAASTSAQAPAQEPKSSFTYTDRVPQPSSSQASAGLVQADAGQERSQRSESAISHASHSLPPRVLGKRRTRSPEPPINGKGKGRAVDDPVLPAKRVRVEDQLEEMERFAGTRIAGPSRVVAAPQKVPSAIGRTLSVSSVPSNGSAPRASVGEPVITNKRTLIDLVSDSEAEEEGESGPRLFESAVAATEDSAARLEVATAPVDATASSASKEVQMAEVEVDELEEMDISDEAPPAQPEQGVPVASPAIAVEDPVPLPASNAHDGVAMRERAETQRKAPSPQYEEELLDYDDIAAEDEAAAAARQSTSAQARLVDAPEATNDTTARHSSSPVAAPAVAAALAPSASPPKVSPAHVLATTQPTKEAETSSSSSPIVGPSSKRRRARVAEDSSDSNEHLPSLDQLRSQPAAQTQLMKAGGSAPAAEMEMVEREASEDSETRQVTSETSSAEVAQLLDPQLPDAPPKFSKKRLSPDPAQRPPAASSSNVPPAKSMFSSSSKGKGRSSFIPPPPPISKTARAVGQSPSRSPQLPIAKLGSSIAAAGSRRSPPPARFGASIAPTATRPLPAPRLQASTSTAPTRPSPAPRALTPAGSNARPSSLAPRHGSEASHRTVSPERSRATPVPARGAPRVVPQLGGLMGRLGDARSSTSQDSAMPGPSPVSSSAAATDSSAEARPSPVVSAATAVTVPAGAMRSSADGAAGAASAVVPRISMTRQVHIIQDDAGPPRDRSTSVEGAVAGARGRRNKGKSKENELATALEKLSYLRAPLYARSLTGQERPKEFNTMIQETWLGKNYPLLQDELAKDTLVDIIEEDQGKCNPGAPPVPVVGDGYTWAPPIEFVYTDRVVYRSGVPAPNLPEWKCNCFGDCHLNPKCACRAYQTQVIRGINIEAHDTSNFEGFEVAPVTGTGGYGSGQGLYVPPARLRDEGIEWALPIFECNSQCACGPDCTNRLIGRGRRMPMALKKTASRGWGVFAEQKIKKGDFLVVYSGELITIEEAEKRGAVYEKLSGRTYIFDLDPYWIGSRVGQQTLEDDGLVLLSDQTLFRAADAAADAANFAAVNNSSSSVGRDRNAASSSGERAGSEREGLGLRDGQGSREGSKGDGAKEGGKGSREAEEPKYEDYTVDPVYAVDAFHFGNISRFFNHCCDPNVAIIPAYIDEGDPYKPLFALFASRDVEKGHELTVQYSMPPDDDEEGDAEDEEEDDVVPQRVTNQVAQKTSTGKMVDCLCGAWNCRGKMFS